MPAELSPIDIRHVPGLEHLVDEVKQTGRPRRILRDREELAVLRPPRVTRQRAVRRRPSGQSITDQTTGALKAYRLPRPLTPDEERAAFAQGVADEVAGERGG